MSLFQTGIRPAVDNHLIKLALEKRDYGDYWSASSAGYCMRKLIFERLGVPYVETESDARKQRLFTAGHIFHEWIQGVTKEAGLSIAQELELQDEDIMVRGHIDDLVLIKGDFPEGDFSAVGEYDFHHSPDKEADHLILYDYKSASSMAFRYKKEKMSHYHRYQLGTYLYMLRKEAAKAGTENSNKWKYPIHNLSEARICLISKDDLRMAELQLMWTPDLEKEIVGYWKTLNGYWKNRKIPKCTCADYEINSKTKKGFMADPRYNPYYYENEPCSLAWYQKYKEEKTESEDLELDGNPKDMGGS